MKKIACFLLLLSASSAFAGVRGDLREAGKLYQDKKYGQALSKYQAALHKEPRQEQASFGAGAASYYLKDYQSAEKAFENTAEQNGSLRQDALFNLGNSYYRAGNKDKAVSAYRQAIIANPKDKEAVHNLQLIIEQQQSEQNQNNQNNKNSSNNSSNQSQQDQNNKGQAPQGQGKEEKPSTPQDAMNKDDADRVMQMARENEYKKPTQPGEAQDPTVEKDW